MAGYQDRRVLYQRIERSRRSKVLLYVTGDRPGMETQIGPDVVDLFVDHLDAVWPAKRITLILYTPGGNTAAAWRLINLLRTFCDELEVVVPSKAHSAGTLMCLGANKIVMTKQATLGPIDPSLSSPLGPHIPGGAPHHKAPVSVEAVQGFLDVATDQLGIKDEVALAGVWTQLSSHIHPLVLGQIFRTRTQIRALARKLLENQGLKEEEKDRIIDFLCSDSGSHDHTINRREARELGLIIEKPSAALYKTLRDLDRDLAETLKLRIPFNLDTELAGLPNVNYSCPRALVESLRFGSDSFVSEGVITRVNAQHPNGFPQVGAMDNRTFEGWRRDMA